MVEMVKRLYRRIFRHYTGRTMMTLIPAEGIRLRVSADKVEIAYHHQVRHWWFWKRWRTDMLASGLCTVRPNSTVQLHPSGNGYVALVDGQPVLNYPPPGGRTFGFGTL